MALEAELAEAKKQLAEHQTAQNALSKQFANSEKQQAELQAKLASKSKITLRHRHN
ncbi:hypothetical protein AB6F61_06885 [Providencia hangzhouensis]|uniref:hypothetical protein n=1 Tax=Providencia hangzhouensis TaxID=3031799 RepID=UPI0034DDC346